MTGARFLSALQAFASSTLEKDAASELRLDDCLAAFNLLASDATFKAELERCMVTETNPQVHFAGILRTVLAAAKRSEQD